ncbi:hypothetical protein [Pseudomonas sp. S3E12]|uniref:hypothetical protein n=1 Tax=Pseudomonas sp. S3E12 TaxID=1873126 RepID=UPI001439B203|nr:hypothetical protein [Pseudomonas sp. S3E12]
MDTLKRVYAGKGRRAARQGRRRSVMCSGKGLTMALKARADNTLVHLLPKR